MTTKLIEAIEQLRDTWRPLPGDVEQWRLNDIVRLNDAVAELLDVYAGREHEDTGDDD